MKKSLSCLIFLFCFSSIYPQSLTVPDLNKLFTSDLETVNGFFQYKGWVWNDSKPGEKSFHINGYYLVTDNTSWKNEGETFNFQTSTGYKNILSYTTNQSNYNSIETEIGADYKFDHNEQYDGSLKSIYKNGSRICQFTQYKNTNEYYNNIIYNILIYDSVDVYNRTTKLCDLCKGVGSISESKTCDHCKGTGRQSCSYCNAKGYNLCGYCKEGFTTCQHCYGNGNITCKDCYGNGYNTCSKCYGTGYTTYSFSGVTSKVKCSACKGSGKITCIYCNGVGSSQCTYCQGSGKTICSHCNGNNKIKCIHCDGTGLSNDDCYYCNGTGLTKEKFTKTCPSCNGTGLKN